MSIIPIYVFWIDLHLPDDNGLELLLEIRDTMPEAFVVMLTTSRLSEDVAMAQRCAANGYITKPFSRRQLQESCESCVQHWDRISRMNLVELSSFRRRIRNEVMATQQVLHKSTPEVQAALHSLKPQWRILVAGAQADVSEQWAAALAADGFVTEHVKSGAEAWKRLNEMPFRLLLTEDTLPDMDAAELLYKMRLNHRSIPAIVVADVDWKCQQPKWRKVGVQKVLNLPLAEGKLQRLVEKEIARSLHELGDIILQN